MTKHPGLIDYDQLVSTYLESLTTVLRGFHPTPEFDFLERWVPEDDAVQSIFGIVEAADEAGMKQVSILIGPKTLETLELVRLQHLTSPLGTVETQPNEHGLVFRVSFGRDHALQEIHPAYRARLQLALQQAGHAALLEEAHAGLELLHASAQGVTLMALVNAADHTVRRAAYHGTASEVQRGLLEVLCQLMEGRPIQECGDHAVIDLEERLRDHTQPPPVPGIVLPTNADPAFALPLELVRQLLAEYRRRVGYLGTANTYDSPMSARWRALSEEEKRAALRTALGQHPSGTSVALVGLEAGQRVIVAFTDSGDSPTPAIQLMRVEAHLKEALEPTLQVYLQPKADENTPRQTQGVQL